MARAYYSTVFEQSADAVWRTIRSFDHYAWAGTGIDAEMEDGRSGDAVGSVRQVVTSDQPLRQRLLALTVRSSRRGCGRSTQAFPYAPAIPRPGPASQTQGARAAWRRSSASTCRAIRRRRLRPLA